MKKINLMALIAGAVLFLGVGATNLSAEMKCGAGKCGAAMEKAAPAMKCGAGKCGAAMMEKPKCCEAKEGEIKSPDCPICKAADCKCDKAVKCTCKDSSKCTCDASKKAPPQAMKCGTGKCGK